MKLGEGRRYMHDSRLGRSVDQAVWSSSGLSYSSDEDPGDCAPIVPAPAPKAPRQERTEKEDPVKVYIKN
jgi:hypothetical protein